jgi:hypothetical protein
MVALKPFVLCYPSQLAAFLENIEKTSCSGIALLITPHAGCIPFHIRQGARAKAELSEDSPNHHCNEPETMLFHIDLPVPFLH